MIRLGLPSNPQFTQNITGLAIGPPVFRRFYLDCWPKTRELQACEENVLDMGRKVAALDAKVGAIERQRDAAIRAAKGGSVWTRTKRASKWIAVGAIVGEVVRRIIAR